MDRKPRFRPGCIEERKTADGLCYYVRFQHTDGKGKKSRPLVRIGLKRDFPSRSAAERAAREIVDRFNATPDLIREEKRKFGDLIDRYIREELPKRHSTSRGYLKNIRNHIRPRWGTEFLLDVRPMQVRAWLQSLPLAGKTKGHIHGSMKILYKFALLWEWIPFGENPMSLFRIEGSTKRAHEPNVITMEQAVEIAESLAEPFRTAVWVAICLGLRCSEIFGLKWSDVLFEDLKIRIERAFTEGKVGDVKTIHSKKAMPLDPQLGSILLNWREKSEFNKADDWIFASPSLAGEMPYRPNNVQRLVLVPNGKRAGLAFALGWHTFRHSYKSWLDERGVALTVQRDLMRHADIRTTAQIYGAVQVERLRNDNSGVVTDLMEIQRRKR